MGTVVGPILQRRKPRLMQIVWFTQSHKSAPLPILTPSPQLPESCEEGNLEPGPHQRGSPRQPLPDWGPHALSWYQSRVAGDWRGPALTGSLSGFIGGGVMAVLGPGGCPGVATTGCDVGVRGKPRETQIRGGGGSLGGPQTPSIPWGRT